MRKVLDVLRLKFEGQLSQDAIAQSLGVSQSTVSEYVQRFRASGLAWPVPPELDHAALEAQLFTRAVLPAAAQRAQPDWPVLHRELRRTGVTLQLLWHEYKAVHPDGYQYTQFCRLYHAWAATLEPVLRQVHPAGERTFIDYAGPTIDVVEPATGELRPAQLFVAALGASHYLFIEATWTQALPDWIASHVRMFEYFGGATALQVPDNLRSGVTHADYYEPTLTRTYEDLAAHYNTAILPARAFHPRDKAKVETGVLIAEREVMAPLRNETFLGLAALNAAIAPLLERINTRPFQKLPGSRRDWFAQLDQPALRPLPPTRYDFAEWRRAKVNIDCHISVERHLYSVPFALVRQPVDVRLTASMLEVLHQGRRVAVHVRSHRPGRFTTELAHLPTSHQAHREWSPSRLIAWGQSIGPATAAVVSHILEHRPHPEHGYRACLVLLSLGRRYTTARLERAGTRALATGAISYRSVKSILATGLDSLPADDTPLLRLPTTHAHVRGAAYFAPELPPELPLTSPGD